MVVGEVQVEGRNYRVYPKVIDAASGALVWQEKFDGELGETETLDLFRIQDEMAGKIVAALLPKLTPAMRAASARGGRTENREALRLYLEATRASNSIDGNQRAVALLQESLRHDSTFSDAWVLMARRLSLGGAPGSRPTELAIGWRQAIDQALEYDSTNADAYGERGFYRYAYEWNWDGAISDLRRAADLNPGLRDPAINFALVLAFLTRTDSALSYARRAVAVDPASPWPWNILEKVYAFSGLADSAMAASERSLAIDSTMWHTNWVLMNAYLDAGREREAEASVGRLLEQGRGVPGFLALAAPYYARAGNREQASRLRNQIEVRAQSEHVSPAAIGIARMAAGDSAGALDALEESLRERDLELASIVSLHFASLHGNRRFEDIRRKLYGDRPMMTGPYR